MSQKEEEKKGKRTIKNNPKNKNPETSSEGNIKTEEHLHHQDKQTEYNQNNPIEVNTMNPQVTIGTSPALYSRDQMLSSPIQNQTEQTPIIGENTINEINQIRKDPTQNPPIVRNQVASPENNIVHHRIIIVPLPIQVKTYKPFKMTCPFCAVNVTTVPELKFNCCFCWLFGCLFFWSLTLALYIYACVAGDFCFYDAVHKCPLCKRIIAQRKISKNNNSKNILFIT